MRLVHGSHELAHGLPVSKRHDGGQGPNLRRVYASIHIVGVIPSSKFGLVTTVGIVELSGRGWFRYRRDNGGREKNAKKG